MSLLAEVTLPDDLQPLPPGPYPDNPDAVLLTGASGYYGAYVLAELLARTRAEIHCLVRAPDPAHGLARIRANLAAYGLADGADFARVRVVPGRLDSPRLGLDDDAYARLAATVTAIYHVAANVNFLPSYAELKPANVDGLREILRLAATARPKPLHTISSYSVFNAADYAGRTHVAEEPLAGDGAGFRRGYPASKWVAERVGDLARARGFDVTTYRAGLIWGDTRTGLCKSDEIVVLNLVAGTALGLAQDIGMSLHLTPVDYCARALVAISLRPSAAGGHYHLIADPPIAWRDLVAWFNARGAAMQFVPPQEWFDRFRVWVRGRPDFLPVLGILSLDPRRSFWSDANLFSMRFATERTRAALAGTGIEPPPINDALLETYRRAFASLAPAP